MDLRRTAIRQSTKVKQKQLLAGQFKWQLTVQDFEKDALAVGIDNSP